MPYSGQLLLDISCNVALIGILGYLLSRLPVVRRTFWNYQYRTSDQVILSLIFGTFSALGNWLGIPVFGAIANTRIVGPIVGGLLGGPLVGLGAGILGAVPRYFMGGYTMWASVVANVAAGLISGTVHRRLGP